MGSSNNTFIDNLKGVVKSVIRQEWFTENAKEHWSSDSHPVRNTNTFAKLENGTCVDLPEKQILEIFGRTRFSDKLIELLSRSLKGKTIDYEKNSEGNILKGNLSDYLDKKGK